MASANENAAGPMGGWIGTIGGLAGLWAGWELTESLIGVLIVGIIGAYVGLAVERLLYKLLWIALCIFMIVVRNGIWNAMVGS